MTEESFELKFKSNFLKRILATVIDYSIFIFLFYWYLKYMGAKNEKGGYTVTGFPAIIIPLFWFAYFVLTEAIYGGTPAHLLFRLKVVTVKRNEIYLKHAFKRRVLDLIDILFYGIPAIIAIKYSDKHQRIGDMLAGTIVIDTTDPEQYQKMK